MAELSRLWSKRCRENMQMQLRYWNLIGRNSGLMFFIYAMILIGGFYYKKWLDSLPGDFPAILIVSLLVAAVCVHAPIRTFIQRADLVFLLPVEEEMGDYFRKSRVYSFGIQSVWLIGIWVISAPLYFHYERYSIGAFFINTVVLFAVKAWMIDCSWQEQLIRETLPFRFLRSALSFCLIYFVLSRQPVYVVLTCAAVMFLVSAFLYHRQTRGSRLHWPRLLDSEMRQSLTFLRFANLFTDVPRLQRNVRPRFIFSRLFPIRHFNEREVFLQIFVKTFLRADDYLGMYVRLTFIGMLLGYLLNLGAFSVFLVISIVYVTGLQLLPIWHYPFPQALAGLYPIEEMLKRQPFVRMVAGLLIMQSVILSAVAGIGARSFADFLFFLAGGLAVSLLFSLAYAKKWLQQNA
ncbi:ABC transporter permease [Sporolactobacillus sp. CPB3-1]|uniref:ABC transporter permease n=1 Tax=Sporolactobacillus mangiferae TaxID=2940498 RepID=A0ABT0M748_9BACL|nr:ABC transporter permease [Sporolactobacillus mangiferae]MCL1630693.1 ABC transporter permease [Sporolactobacillus mangiferae]